MLIGIYTTSENVIYIRSYFVLVTYTKNQNQFCRKLILRKNYCLYLIFFLFFPALLFIPKVPTRSIFLSEKILLKKIQTLLLS